MKYKNFKFDIFGDTYKVIFKDNVYDGDTFLLGQTQTAKNIIYISTKDHDGEELQDNVILTTLYHEMFHAILFAGQYNNCGEDEPLVEWQARCLNALIKQNVLCLGQKISKVECKK